MSDAHKTNRIVAGLVFMIAFGVYLKTMAPTTSFWDCGEYIATSYILGVPHPPGAPLYILIGRLFTFLPFWEEIARRVNLISVLSSALTVMLTYLITVRLIKLWKGKLDTPSDRVTTYVGGVVAALSLAFSDTFWFNAVEAEVYAPSMLLTSLGIWLALLWMEKHRISEGNRLLLFVVYLFGLGGGVHLLCWLTIPTILMLMVFTDTAPLKNVRLWVAIPVLFLLGYSTYYLLMVRAGLDPTINENDPATWESFKYFLQRKQYGEESILLNMLDRRADFWGYQVWNMYIKYFFQQFSLTLVNWTATFRAATGNIPMPVKIPVIPLALGFGGMILHGRKDPKRLLAFLALFVIMGFGLVVYLNMPDPQPRERDYAFVGAFWAFALWIGIGATGLLDVIKERAQKQGESTERGRTSWAVLAGSVVLLSMPAHFLTVNYHSHDRTGDYIGHDYGYNILMSCEPNAILFTNGDNDTFPLWFLQEVKGIRKDVRVVNLSLLNTKWFIKQLRDYEPKVPIRMTDRFLDEKLDGGIPWPSEEMSAAGITWKLAGCGTYQARQGDTVRTIRYFRIQDLMVIRIIHKNQWKQPIYFAVTVSRENKIGLEDYLRMEGMVYRLVQTEGKNQLEPERSRRNLFEVYQYRGIKDPKVYKDTNTAKLLGNYRAAYFQLAYTYQNQGEMDRAFETMKHAEQTMELGWQGCYTIVQMAHQAGRNEEGLEYLEQTMALEGERNPEAMMRFAYYANALGDPAEAIRLYRSVTELDPASPEPYYLMATLLERQEDYAGALAAIKRAAELDPASPKPYYGLAALLEKQEDYAGALAAVERLVQFYPNEARFEQEIEALTKKMETAEADSQSAISSQPSAPRVPNPRGEEER
jgi:tetratricopeptide (TPR) repeat protein